MHVPKYLSVEEIEVNVKSGSDISSNETDCKDNIPTN